MEMLNPRHRTNKRNKFSTSTIVYKWYSLDTHTHDPYLYYMTTNERSQGLNLRSHNTKYNHAAQHKIQHQIPHFFFLFFFLFWLQTLNVVMFLIFKGLQYTMYDVLLISQKCCVYIIFILFLSFCVC